MFLFTYLFIYPFTYFCVHLFIYLFMIHTLRYSSLLPLSPFSLSVFLSFFHFVFSFFLVSASRKIRDDGHTMSMAMAAYNLLEGMHSVFLFLFIHGFWEMGYPFHVCSPPCSWGGFSHRLKAKAFWGIHRTPPATRRQACILHTGSGEWRLS